MENLFKNLLQDKLMPLLLELLMKDIMVMIYTILLMLKLLKLLLFTTTISVMNINLIKMMIQIKSQVLCMEDIKVITMEEEILGSYPLLILLISSIEVLFMLNLKEINSLYLMIKLLLGNQSLVVWKTNLH